MEEHINNMGNFCESATEMDFIESTVHCMEYFESNYLFFSTMLASEGAPYFRNRFLTFNIEEFKNDVDITKGKNHGQSEDVIVHFVANAYVGVVEWWLKNGMPDPPRVMAEKVGDLLERII
ncbi:Transcriptional regulator, TetR [Bacillus cereus R309803]|nr:Transcriptional regulator, TetR [Bacillus cereus R309803]